MSNKLLNILNEEVSLLEEKTASNALKRFKELLKKKKAKAILGNKELDADEATNELGKMMKDKENVFYDVFDVKDAIMIKRFTRLGDEQTFSIRTPTAVAGVRG